MAGIEASKTQQVYLVLRDRITGGRFAECGALPGEQALAAEHGVSRVTVRRALAQLERDGLISRRRGSGTFVSGAGDTKPILADFSDVLANLIAMGRKTGVRLLEFAYRDPPPAVREVLRMAAGEQCQYSVRVRLIDGQPFSYLTTHVPARIGVTYSEADLAAQPLLALLERSGVEVTEATQDITAVLASPEVAGVLDVEIGSPLIAITRTVYTSDGAGVEHLRALYRPDRYVFRMSMVRRDDGHTRRWAAVMTPHHGDGASPAPRPARRSRSTRGAL